MNLDHEIEPTESIAPKVDDHNLRYTRNEDGKLFHVKRLVEGEYSIKDPETGEKFRLTRKRLRNSYSTVKKNAQENAA